MIEAFDRDHLPGDVIGAQRHTRCGSEHAEAEPRQFVPGEIPVAPIGALRTDRLGVEICRENAERAINVHQIGPVLIKLALQLIPSPRLRPTSLTIDLDGGNERLRGTVPLTKVRTLTTAR